VNAEALQRALPDDDRWQDRASCKGMTDTFYPVVGKGQWDPGGTPEERRAKAVCLEQCPVRSQCLDVALANREPAGIWGGLTERERSKLTRRRREASPDRPCQRCGVPFSKAGGYRYCDECRAGAAKEAQERRQEARRIRGYQHACVVCGAVFTCGSAHRLYCSDECRSGRHEATG